MPLSDRPGYLKRRSNAVANAFKGIVSAMWKEPHLKVSAVAALLVVSAGWILNIDRLGWFIVSCSVCMVISLELINSAVEKLCDHLNPQMHQAIRYVKDVLAGAVLVAVVFSLVSALIVFMPYIRALL